MVEIDMNHMTFQECRLLMAEDKKRFKIDSTGKRISVILTSFFRIGNYLMSKHNIVARFILFFYVKPIYFVLRLLTGIQLPLGTKVMGGVRFPHYSCIIIAKSCFIGKNCTIHQGVTLGQSHFGKHQGYPTIGNNVLIYAGAKICGRIHIGNNVVIGANAVITNDIPDNCVVVGHNKIVSTDSYNVLGERGRKIFW